MLGYIRSGFEEGARARWRAAQRARARATVKPTVLVDTRDDMRVVREEIFGPVVVAMPYDDLDEVARRANDTPYGLGASIWSNDLSRAFRLVPKIKAGTVWVNCHNILDARCPSAATSSPASAARWGAVLDLCTEGKSVIMAL